MNRNSSTPLPEKPRIIFMGTPVFSVPALEALINAGYEIPAVVTQPDRPRGRGRFVVPSAVKEAAIKHDVSLLQPETVNCGEFYETVKSLRPDFFIVIAFGQLLKKDLLDIPEFGAFNIHASLLPQYRGAAPIHHTILNGDSKTGLTLMRMDEGMDTGPVIFQEEVHVRENETFGELYYRLSLKSGELTVNFLRENAGKPVYFTPQDNSLASYAPKLHSDIAVVNWSEDAERISCIIRALDPAPGASTLLENKKIKLFSSRVFDSGYKSGLPGRFHTNREGLFLVETGKGIIEIGQVQVPGKKRIPAAAFLNGHLITDGTVLG